MIVPLVLVLLVTANAPAPPRPAAASPMSAEDRARDHYRTGLSLFESGDKAQALIEFQMAQELAPRPENLVMIAHCEYHLGDFAQARTHYEAFLAQQGRGELAEIARQRIEAINRRYALLVITTVPSEVEVRLEQLAGGTEVITGDAPNEFRVPKGRWRVTVKKPNYVTESSEVEVDNADTKPLFFSLERQPARIEVHTNPRNANLFVRGNRARNPYIQDVEPGLYEIYAEAEEYEPRTETYYIRPGETRRIDFPLRYVQRSGRPEIIGFWTTAGAVAGGALVSARLGESLEPNAESISASAAVIASAAAVGGVVGALASNAFTPAYIPDNRALFHIGAAWMGAAEGALLGAAIDPTLAPAWVGGAVGLGVGALTGSLLDQYAPNYGRAALIQSAAGIGILAGAVTVPALDIEDPQKRALVVLGGLNLGLATGLALAYLPDQDRYGPRWQDVMLVNLATAAGTIAGALVKTVGECVGQTKGTCDFESNGTDESKERARFALIGGSLGLVTGWLLTRNNEPADGEEGATRSMSFVPVPTALPTRSPDGDLKIVPGLGTAGRF